MFDRKTVCSISHSANILPSISTNTDYLIYGEKPGSKIVKAKKLNIKILSEQEWTALLN